MIDTAVAAKLQAIAQSVHLMGSEVILTGISAQVAQTISTLGVQFAGILTTGNLQDGVQCALARIQT
jgi:rsbT co-antagonist protein RsbR